MASVLIWQLFVDGCTLNMPTVASKFSLLLPLYLVLYHPIFILIFTLYDPILFFSLTKSSLFFAFSFCLLFFYIFPEQVAATVVAMRGHLHCNVYRPSVHHHFVATPSPLTKIIKWTVQLKYSCSNSDSNSFFICFDWPS